MLKLHVTTARILGGIYIMLEFEELKQKLNTLKPQIDDLRETLSLDKSKAEISELLAEQAKPDFWNESKNSQSNIKKLSKLKARVSAFEQLFSMFEDAETLVELGNELKETEDIELLSETKKTISNLENELENQRLSTLLNGEYDQNNAILSFHSGAGGTEAQDWVQMLYRMYYRWAERHNMKVSTLDFLDGEEAGLKSICILIEGLNAYGYLKGEAGVHRLVRISPFDASGRRHTSFASLEVMPEIDEDVEVEISADDIKMDVFRASGAGGQKVNKTSSAVRLTHIPTGIVVSCQVERSQHQNREVAMRMLLSKLTKIKEQEKLEKISDIKGIQKEIAWGSQIRSYVFMPYTLVKDHRTNFEVGNINSVMDGDLDGFINAYLKAQELKKL